MSKKYTKKQRSQAADMFDRGYGTTKVSNELGIPRGTICKWYDTFRVIGRDGLLAAGGKHRNYSRDLKLAAVEMVENGIPKSVVMVRLGIVSRTTLDKWVNECREKGFEALTSKAKGGYRGFGGIRYDQELKFAAVKAVDGGMSLNETMSEFGIVSRKSLQKWIVDYREGGIYALHPKPKGKRPPNKIGCSYEMKIAALKNMEEGMSVTQVARKFGVSRASVYGWLKTYLENGADTLRPKQRGRPRR